MTLAAEEHWRMMRAMAIGYHADRLFARVCRRLDVPVALAMHAPLLMIATAQAQPHGRA